MGAIFKSLVVLVVLMLPGAYAAGQDQTALPAATATALNDALATGDVAAIQAVIVANGGNPAALQAIATTLLAAAQSLKATDGASAGVLAALAAASGGLSGSSATTAMNIANTYSSSVALNILALSGAGAAPSVINSVLVGVTISPVQIAQNGANVANSNSGSVQ